MRDLFSGCMYMCTYMLVMLRNVNLRLCSGPQVSLIRALYMRTSMEDGGWSWGGGMTFLGDGGLGGHGGWAFAAYVFGGVECRNEC